MQVPLSVESTVVSDDEDYQDNDVPPPSKPRRTLWSQLTGLLIGRTRAEEEARQPHHYPNTTIFNINGPTINDNPPPIVIEEEEEGQTTTVASKLLQYPQRFGHISFRKLKKMAQYKIIPSNL